MHVYATLVRKDAEGWLSAFIENGWPAHPKAQWHLVKVGDDRVLFCTAPGEEWVNVFAKDAGKYARFGFHTAERRWAYGAEPPDAALIASAIEECDKPKFPRFELPQPLQVPKVVPKAAMIPKAVAVSPPGRRSRWTVATAAIALALVIVGVIILRGREQLKSIGWFSTTGTLSPAGSAPQSAGTRATPASAPAATQVNNNAARPPKAPWNVTTLRAVKVKIGRTNTTIPKGTQLHVLGRSDIDLMVSYKGSTVMIPAGATDVR
jgi:hypothetical protein